MNPARTFGPDLASTTFTSYWVYVAGPIAGAVIAVVIAFVLRGRAAASPARERRKATCSPRLRARQVLRDPGMRRRCTELAGKAGAGACADDG